MEIHHKLLILDDDADVAKTIARIAEGIGFAVRFCSVPADFFATLERWRPSHLAVDLVMPALDGMEVLRQLAERGCNAQVIVTSGMGTKVLESAQRSGVERGLAIAGILPKPFRSQLLAVPALRARYLRYVRDIADRWLDWKRLGPIAARYQALIAADVEADTRKLYSFDQFDAASADRESIRSFAERRRAYLLAYAPPDNQR